MRCAPVSTSRPNKKRDSVRRSSVILAETIIIRPSNRMYPQFYSQLSGYPRFVCASLGERKSRAVSVLEMNRLFHMDMMSWLCWLLLRLNVVSHIIFNFLFIRISKQTRWLESASELYWPSDRHLSTKFVPTFADRGVSRSKRGWSPTAVFFVFLTWNGYFFISSSSSM
jgi:hypothetical protein